MTNSSMNRRDFLHRSALIAAGVVAADQIELLERLAHVRKSFPVGDPTALMFRQNFTSQFRRQHMSDDDMRGFHYSDALRNADQFLPGDGIELFVPGYVSPSVAVGVVQAVRPGQLTVQWTEPYDARLVAALRANHPKWSKYWS